MAVPKSKISKRRRKTQIKRTVEQRFLNKKLFPIKNHNKFLYKEELREMLDNDLSNIKESPYTAGMRYYKNFIRTSTSGVYKNKNKFSLSKKNRRLFWKNKKRKDLHRREEVQMNTKLLKRNTILALEYKRLSIINWKVYKNSLFGPKPGVDMGDSMNGDCTVESSEDHHPRPKTTELDLGGYWDYRTLILQTGTRPLTSYFESSPTNEQYKYADPLGSFFTKDNRVGAKEGGDFTKPIRLHPLDTPNSSDKKSLFNFDKRHIQYMDVDLFKKKKN